MGDEKQYTIQVKGTAYKFKPIPPEDLAMVIVVMNMNASQTKTVKAIAKAVSASAGAEQWDEITDRLIAGEVTLEEVTVGVVKRLIERQAKDKAEDLVPAADAQ